MAESESEIRCRIQRARMCSSREIDYSHLTIYQRKKINNHSCGAQALGPAYTEVGEALRPSRCSATDGL